MRAVHVGSRASLFTSKYYSRNRTACMLACAISSPQHPPVVRNLIRVLNYRIGLNHSAASFYSPAATTNFSKATTCKLKHSRKSACGISEQTGLLPQPQTKSTKGASEAGAPTTRTAIQESTNITMAAPSEKTSIVWFRKGLRMHDNPALVAACEGAKTVYPVFVLDPYFLKQTTFKVGVNRYNFLLESMTDLDASLRARGTRLLVIRGNPAEVLPRVIKEWGVTHLYYELDTEPYSKVRDSNVTQLAQQAGAEVHAPVGLTLYDTDMLVARNGGKPPLTMQAFTKLVDKQGPPPAPLPAPTTIPPFPAGAKGTEEEAVTIPTWEEVGFKAPPTTPFKGGESEALRRLEDYMKDGKWVAAFEKPATDPSAFLRPATTVLSPHLKFGTLSPRTFHARLLEIYAKHPKHAQPPVSLRGQLLWREFFYTVGANTPNFTRMAGNPVCRQIDWDDNPEFVKAWAEARTGYPWIDAIMTQLRQWGWVHHLARHSVACFLTRGDLYCSWEAGQAVFEELLVDQDTFLNAGNWMWLSASAFFSQYFRVYSPISFGKKYDPDGKFVRQFLPVLKDMPAKYIYEPWTAPLEVQQRAKCIIGRDYPKPIVDHAVASKACIARMGAAYRAGKAEAGGGSAEGEEGATQRPAGKGGVKGRQPTASAKSGSGRQRTLAETIKKAAPAVAAAAPAVPTSGTPVIGQAVPGAVNDSSKRPAKRQRTLTEAGLSKK